MDPKVRENMESVEKMAAADPQYRQMLLDMRAIEKRYNEVLATLAGMTKTPSAISFPSARK